MTSEPRIAILLASFQGARFLDAQLESLVAQSYRNWRLVVSDDGSTDGTTDILRRFAAAHPGRDIQIRQGPQKGATQNFLSMIEAVEPGEAMAWCDQDDVWRPDRLSRGIAALAAQRGARSGGFLHVTRTTICDQALRPLRPAPLFQRRPGFANALVQACTPGNTTLVDPAGAALLKVASRGAAAADVVSHDWWTYQVITGAGGQVIRDPAQTVLYRQHPDNVSGRNDTPRAMWDRINRVGAGEYGDWLRRNTVALAANRAALTVANGVLLDDFSAALDATGPRAAAQLVRLGVYRQTRAGTAALLLAAAAGRLARSR